MSALVYRAATAAVFTFVTVAAHAQDGPQGFSAGLAAGVSSSPYVGEDDELGAVPFLSYQGNGFSVGTNGVSVTVLNPPSGQLEAVLTPRFSALSDPDSSALQGIDRDITADIGLRYTWSLAPETEVRATLLQEVTGEHDGQEADLQITQSLIAGRLPMQVFAGATWRSEELSEYMYGVLPGEAQAGRPAYAPGSTIVPYIGASAAFPLSDSTSLFGAVRAEFLQDAITDSPIIDDSASVGVQLGLRFAF